MSLKDPDTTEIALTSAEVLAARERDTEPDVELDEVDRGSAEECPSCGAVTEPEYLACPVCACRLSPACPSCDRKVLEHWKACPYCCIRLDQPAARKALSEASSKPAGSRHSKMVGKGSALTAAK